MSIVDKARYLMATKSGLKDIINEKGGTIDNETPFRSYINQIKSFQLSGEQIDFNPIRLFTVNHPCSGTGAMKITAANIVKDELYDEYLSYDETTGEFTVLKDCKIVYVIDMYGRSSGSNSNTSYGGISVNGTYVCYPGVRGGEYHSVTPVYIDAAEGTKILFNRMSSSGYLTIAVRMYLFENEDLFNAMKILDDIFATR